MAKTPFLNTWSTGAIYVPDDAIAGRHGRVYPDGRSKERWERAMEWFRSHKLRTALIAIAVSNGLYLIWCAVTDHPSHWLAGLLVPLTIMAGLFLTRIEQRDLR